MAGSVGGGVSDKDITNVLQGFQHRRVNYGYSRADVQAIAKKAILVERSKAVPPSAATSSSAPLMGGTGKHAGTKKPMCRVCGEHHITSAGAPKCELACWNKHHKDERQGDPAKRKDRDAFRKLAESDPDKYYPYAKKQRVG